MKMKEDGIRGVAYRDDRAAERLGITVDDFHRYADHLGIGKRRLHGCKGAWYTVFDLEDIADLMGMKDRNWINPFRGFRLPK